MPDIIQLLPEVVANQIAAGEVIQRPASALKELMENAVDAGSTTVKVYIREAGKSLIQVVDNGIGMSETDARMSFERYATSKLRKAEDLYSISTMGFRGEALASIAAIAHVELKTKKANNETGVQLVIEGGELISSQAFACNTGTSIAVKNLFYNVPARRNFLKSNASEMRSVMEEFQRVALVNFEREFTLHHNETEVFHLKPGNFRQRITGVFGSGYNERLVPVEEETTLINIKGFIGKPEFAKKIRGEQYFFVNKRFIKDPYLHHAVTNAFEDLLPQGAFAAYFLMLEIDPAKIDINVHPTKTEIKFEDDKAVYAILRASVKRSLGKYSVAPTLDFNQETTFNLPLSKLSEIPVPPQIKVNVGFNPFKTSSEIKFPSTLQQSQPSWQNKTKDWSVLYQGLEEVKFVDPIQNQTRLTVPEDNTNDWIKSANCFQLAGKYIAMPYEDKLLLVNQQAAHERILYEKNIFALQNQPVSTQQLIFPKTIEFNTQIYSLILEIKNELTALGFDINEFGKNTFVVHGIPPLTDAEEIKQMLETMAEQFLFHKDNMKLGKLENIAQAAAIRMALKQGKVLFEQEMKKLITDLFTCNQPAKSPSGKQIFCYLYLNEIDKKFSS